MSRWLLLLLRDGGVNWDPLLRQFVQGYVDDVKDFCADVPSWSEVKLYEFELEIRRFYFKIATGMEMQWYHKDF